VEIGNMVNGKDGFDGELESLGLCSTCLDEDVETPAKSIGLEDVLYSKRHALCCTCGKSAEHVSPDGHGYCTSSLMSFSYLTGMVPCGRVELCLYPNSSSRFSRR
jgi:hypothetical protein